MPLVDVLLPTCNRLPSLILTLSGIAAQSLTDLHLVVADQSEPSVEDAPVVRTLCRVMEARGGSVEWHHRTPSRGICEQRDFLLGRARSGAVLFLDDDVFMEPWVLARLLQVLRDEHCGFVGAFPAGLSFRDDRRPHQQFIEFWEGPVHSEVVEPGTPAWERRHLHRAANHWHVAADRNLTPSAGRRYKVAWIASCVLYDRGKLLDVGGFTFWDRLPRYHSGEDVLVQNLLLRRWGGCAILPSGTYHAEVPSTVLNAAGRVDGHALELLPDLVTRHAPGTATPHTSSIPAMRDAY